MTGPSLDPPNAGADRAFADDRHETDVAGAGRMGAATQFDRIDRIRSAQPVLASSHRNDPDLVAVFLAEQARAPLARASSIAMSLVTTGSFCRMIRFAISSTSVSSSAEIGF